VPVLPTVPITKYCAVYNLPGDLLHGMEEVTGSIPISSTKTSPKNLNYLIGECLSRCGKAKLRSTPDYDRPIRTPEANTRPPPTITCRQLSAKLVLKYLCRIIAITTSSTPTTP
jgi:hypothetical protein